MKLIREVIVFAISAQGICFNSSCFYLFSLLYKLKQSCLPAPLDWFSWEWAFYNTIFEWWVEITNTNSHEIEEQPFVWVNTQVWIPADWVYCLCATYWNMIFTVGIKKQWKFGLRWSIFFILFILLHYRCNARCHSSAFTFNCWVLVTQAHSEPQERNVSTKSIRKITSVEEFKCCCKLLSTAGNLQT